MSPQTRTPRSKLPVFRAGSIDAVGTYPSKKTNRNRIKIKSEIVIGSNDNLTAFFIIFISTIKIGQSRCYFSMSLTILLILLSEPVFPAGFSDTSSPWIPRRKQDWRTPQTHFRFPCWSAPRPSESLHLFLLSHTEMLSALLL